MKKLLLVISCLISFHSYSQAPEFVAGVEGGFSMASLRGNDLINELYDPRIGNSAGVFFQYNFDKMFSFRTGGYLERKGGSFKATVTNDRGDIIGEVKVNENFDYLVFPLMCHVSFKRKAIFFINSGPFIGFLIKKNEVSELADFLPSMKINNADYFKKTEIGLSAGIGLSFTVKEIFSIGFEIRDNLGLSNTSVKGIYNYGTIKTNSLNLLVGLGYNIVKNNSSKENFKKNREN